MKSSLVFLVTPHQECIKEDIVRLQSSINELNHLHQAFEEELNDHCIPYCKITDLDRITRVATVLGELERMKTLRNK